MDKLWYILTIEYYSAIKKNTFESVLMRWMKLEPIIQSLVSQKEKHQYSILTHIYRSQKDGNDDLIGKKANETQIKRTDFWTLWEKMRVGWSERLALKHVHYHVWNRWPVQVQCMKQGTQSQCSGMRWGGRWEEGFRMEGHMYTCGWFISMYGKKHHSILISLQLK